MSNDVLVVIVTYNSARVIGALLESLPAALGRVMAEVVVVDNGSSDGTPELVAARGDCRLVRYVNRGYAAGINRGVAEGSPARAILVLNPDVVLATGSVGVMLAELQKPGVGVVAPLVREEDGTISLSMRREPTLSRALGLGRTGHPKLAEYVTAAEAYSRPQDVDWALGAALLVSSECHNALGGWDESFFLYSEETDFCLRARDLGYRIRFQPAAEIMHIGGASGQSGDTHAMQATNRVRLYRRRHGRPAAFAYLLLCVASELSWHLRGNPHSLAAVRALLRPATRPTELSASRNLIPR